ncbi:hypothetical protein JRO89_XS12G0030600 [Xanthoceras sorbifolium]|uniref:RING-type E3 ubiquitin transferase n=1 Tax=Xanthoceras sorbifolium TaxID=99658 RepID=A0ABQ8HAS4_9ROSI|nr:hypothetical protein JRO89_XS12G0030600 [Xanthoceras sorbifolium]
MVAPPAPYVEHQKAVTIRNDVNLKKESLRLEADEENPGSFLVSFTFDATVAGSRLVLYTYCRVMEIIAIYDAEFHFRVIIRHNCIYLANSITVMFFAKEGEDCILAPTKENLAPVTVHFPQGLGQKFRQPSGTGIDFSMFEETELLKEGNMDVYPLAVKAEASPVNQNGSDGNPIPGPTNSQLTQAVFEKEKGEYRVRVVKQILWVNGMRYELQEIYGIGNSADGDVDANDPGKECVICLSEPRDTTVLPCRHMVHTVLVFKFPMLSTALVLVFHAMISISRQSQYTMVDRITWYSNNLFLAGLPLWVQCMCSGCAKVLRFQTNRCPICRQPVERLLEIKVNGHDE